MQAPSSSTITMFFLLPLLGWRIYARFRRMVGRQRLSRIRPWITLTIFPTLLALLVYAGLSDPGRLWWLGAGMSMGVLLGLFGLSKTVFEPTRQGLYYTPNAHLGIALSLLFTGRIVYRIAEVTVLHPAASYSVKEFAHSKLTLTIFGLLASYYICYAIGLARWRARVLRAKRQREAQAAALQATGSD